MKTKTETTPKTELEPSAVSGRMQRLVRFAYFKRLWRCVNTQGLKFGILRFRIFNKAMASSQGPDFWAERLEERAKDLTLERKHVGAGHMLAAARDLRDREIDTTD